MIILESHLPWPPSVNHYWKQGIKFINGKRITTRYKSPKACKFIADVKKIIGKTDLSISRVGVEIIAFMPDKRIRDIDNLAKGVLDSLVAARLILDDSQIDDLRIIRGDVVKGGMIKIKVWEILQ